MHMISIGFVLVHAVDENYLDNEGIDALLEKLELERASDFQVRLMDPRYDVPMVLSMHDEEITFPSDSVYVSYTGAVYPKGRARFRHIEEPVTALVEAGPGFKQPAKSVIVNDRRNGIRFTDRDLPKDSDI